MLADLRHLFRQDRAIHLTLIVTITIGFCLGYIKDHNASPLSYFLFDLGLFAALAFWLAGRIRYHAAIFPRTPLTRALIIFYITCFLYALHPDVPLLIGISAFRGWCVFSLAFLLGYDIIRSPRQVKTYLLVVVLLAVVTGLYGLYQYSAGIESAIQPDELIAERHQYATYITPAGEIEFRIFSTFVSAGAFGAMMAYASFIALTLATSKALSGRVRFLLILAMVPMLTSMVLTGTRAAIVMMLIGLMVFWWFKHNMRVYLGAAALLYIGIQLGIGLTEGRAADRFATLADPELISDRLSGPFMTGFNALIETPMGGGLGRTGHGVPFFLGGWYPQFQTVFSDGDFGRIMIEMGVVGLILLTYVLFTAIRGAIRSLRILQKSPHEDLALAIVGGAIMVGVGTLVGSPFLGIPHGMLWWFFLGAAFKLSAIYQQEQSQAWFAMPVRRRRARKVIRG